MSRECGKLCSFLIVVTFLVCIPVGSVWCHDAPVRVAVLSCMDPVKTYKKFHPLAHYLETQIGREVSLLVPRDYSAFMRMVKQGQVDFSYQPAHIFLTLENYLNPEMRLSTLTMSGERQHRALLIVRADSSIKGVADLRGKSVLFGPEQSTVKSFAAKQLLVEHGINLESDLHDSSYGSSCEKTAFNVYLKAYDAGFVCAHSYHTLMGRKNSEWPIPPASLRVVAKTNPIPTWIFSASKNVNPEMVTVVREALLALSSHPTEEHLEILHNIESSGFDITSENDLRMLRKRFVSQ